MVAINDAQKANQALSATSLNAVFVGATSEDGIGLSTLEALLRNTLSSRVYIIGRSESQFAPLLSKLQQIRPSHNLVFIEAQVSLLNEVKRVTDMITAKESSIDLLWLSQGGLSAAPHNLNSEGLFEKFAVTYYSRILFMYNFASLLAKSGRGRVISVLATGVEGPINIADPGLRDSRNYHKAGFWGAQKQGVSMMSLAMEELARTNQTVSFCHTMPGMVSTSVHHKWADTMTGAWLPLRWIMKGVMIPLMHAVALSPQHAGQVGLYEATNDRYSSKPGKNFYRLKDDGEDEAKGESVLMKYREDGTQEKIWEHTESVFKQTLVQ